MPPTLATARVLVGYDGSPTAGGAVEWAAREAIRRAAPLVVATVEEHLPQRGAALADTTFTPVGGASDRDIARARLQALLDRVAEAHPGLALHGELRDGSAPDYLVAQSAEPGLVVVGTRGSSGPLSGLLGGGLADAVVPRALGPVAVVPRAQRIDGPGDPGGPIVVGVDAGPSWRDALDLAVSVALRDGAPVQIVRSVPADDPTMPSERLQVAPFGADIRADHRAEAALADLVTAVRAQAPSIQVAARMRGGAPEVVLAEASRTARLLVVGRRHPAGDVTVVGSTSRRAAHATRCPVLVVPS